MSIYGPFLLNSHSPLGFFLSCPFSGLDGLVLNGYFSSSSSREDIFISSRARRSPIQLPSQWCQGPEKCCKSIFHGVLRPIWHPCTTAFHCDDYKGDCPEKWASGALWTNMDYGNGMGKEDMARLNTIEESCLWKGKVSDRAGKKISVKQLLFTSGSASIGLLFPDEISLLCEWDFSSRLIYIYCIHCTNPR